jgi:sulfide:quinone oxidoreductase
MTTAPESFEVVIVGGGVAGLEGALALRNLAGDRVSLKLMAPSPDFVYRPMTVREPFSWAVAERYPLPEIAPDIGAELVKDALVRVDPGAQVVHGESGSELRYDALLLGLGAKIRARYEHAVTLNDARLDELLHGLIQDVEGGYVNRLGFVVPPRMAWPLPVYELALMTSRRAYDMNVEVAATIVTPEDAPLAVFGQGVSQAVAELLAERGIEVIVSAYCEVPRTGVIEISPGERTLEVDRVVALPELDGPAVPGLPHTSDGFIPVDDHCRVRDTERVYAAGDAVDFAVKHGGIAAQQADTAAQAIAALAGAPVDPQPFRPSIHGVLLTGEEPRYLSAEITGGRGLRSELTDEPTWSPPTKISARYLAPYLEQLGRTGGRS